MAKVEFPPLLGAGFHKLTAAELKAIALDKFSLSKSRATLWGNLSAKLDELKSLGLKCDVWVDGSFLTQKIDPDDVDLVIDIPINAFANLTSAQLDFVQKLGASAFRRFEKLHTFVMFNAPLGHVEYPVLGLSMIGGPTTSVVA